MEMKKFKTESQKILDMMINSIYTHKEIFIREILSNASDAIDKLYYKSLTDGISGLSREDFAIEIKADKEARTLTVTDNGIGMTAEELDSNLGVIAKSGSQDFKNNKEKKEDINIIGQFGVGFYSAFMVSDKVEVISKAYGSDEANKWTSNGSAGYEIAPAEREGHGTTIIMHIR
ncbi:MAG: ATP-binding protein, partial [Clostridia bacterium]|nr:ATP-binding protein [Clostridia bacterium]